METNTVLISLEKYNEMFKTNLDQEKIIRELEESIKKKEEQFNQIKNVIYQEVYSNNNWELRQMHELNNDDYQFRSLTKSLMEKGYADFEEIKTIIEKMYNQKQEELKLAKEEISEEYYDNKTINRQY